jgi:hypothetical protein
VQLIEIALAPIGGSKAQPSDKSENYHENCQCYPIHFLHDLPSSFPFLGTMIIRQAVASILGREIHNCRKHGGDDYQKELKPIEKWNAHPVGLDLVVEGRPESNDELDCKEQVPPTPSAPLQLR